jgi:uncharacterized membrane protein YbhN (UPF0104 family)
VRFFKVAVGIGLLVWLLHRSGTAELGKAIMQIRGSAFAVALLIFIAGLSIAALKWRALLEGFRWRTLLAANLISLFYSLLLSGQIAGEAVKAYKIGRGRDDAGRVVASILTDKLTGLFALACVGLAGAAVGAQAAPRAAIVLLAGVATGIAAGFGIVLVPQWDRAVVKLISWASTRAPRFRGLLISLRQVHDAMAAYARQPGPVLRAMLLGLLFQAANVAIVKVFATELGIPLDAFDLALVFSVVSLAVLLPLSIAGLGIREGTFAAVLGLYGVGVSTSVALSLSIFSLQLLSACVGAVVDLRFSRGVRLGD